MYCRGAIAVSSVRQSPGCSASKWYQRRQAIRKARLGSWWRVADELAVALADMGRQWERGCLTIAEEHGASNALAPALARVGDALPIRFDGPKRLLACAAEDEHTLGLSLAESCLRELGHTPHWLGRRTPVDEVVRLVREGAVATVALTRWERPAKRRACGFCWAARVHGPPSRPMVRA